ncbi:MAG: methyltransferase [Bacteroidales bacterium]|nr:methyltransferase [Bacteroidales bacterium]
MKKNIFQYKHFSIDQTHAGMKVGTDSDLLGTLAHGGPRLLDIGTGTGIIALMMAQRYAEAQITAIEIDNDAVLDATTNFAASPWEERITLIHDSFQHYLEEAQGKAVFDAVVCNPPYFDRSLECPDLRRLRARHSSSLPFEVLIEGAYSLLADGGTFSVCIPPEVLTDFLTIGANAGFSLLENNQVQALPNQPAKRYVLVFVKASGIETQVHNFCMRNEDRTYTEWYKKQLGPFLTGKIYE